MSLCFNPRPARVPGDARRTGRSRCRATVSIRARHVCRAMRTLTVIGGDAGAFQSAPGTCAGRCCLARPYARRRSRFQSAPGTCAGRCIRRCSDIRNAGQFQSAPGTCAGRCQLRLATGISAPGFNPRPARVPGDASGRTRQTHPAAGFNPRPARVPGDAATQEMLAMMLQVSIRARHVCRAMPSRVHSTRSGLAFQSAPGTCAGRCNVTLAQDATGTGFNPRPARVPGDARSSRAT